MSQLTLDEPIIDEAGSATLSQRDFARIRALFQQWVGVTLGDDKLTLVHNRLHRRVVTLGLTDFRAYADLLSSADQVHERQIAVDLLTTNETYFFREPAHFAFLHEWVQVHDEPRRAWRAWSAASSSGEEAYSIALTLADALGPSRWEVLGSDVSQRVLERARRAHYPLKRVENFPAAYLRRFCLKGIGPYEGTLLIDRPIRERVQFTAINLMRELPALGTFDVIFLRNMLIYFTRQDRQEILRRIARVVRPAGLVVVGHSESLFDLNLGWHVLGPGIYKLSR